MNSRKRAASKPSKGSETVAKKQTPSQPQTVQTQLPPECVLLLSKAIQPKLVGQARSQLAVGVKELDITVRVRGSLTIEPDTPSSRGEAPAPVSLWGAGFISALLRELGVGSKRLEAATRTLCDAAMKARIDSLTDASFAAQEDLIATLNTLAADYQSRLPKLAYDIAGKTGAVNALASVELIESRDVFPRIAPGTEREQTSRKKTATKKKVATKKRA